MSYIKIHGSLQKEIKRLGQKSIGRLFHCMGHFLRNGADCIMILGTTPVLLSASVHSSHS